MSAMNIVYAGPADEFVYLVDTDEFAFLCVQHGHLYKKSARKTVNDMRHTMREHYKHTHPYDRLPVGLDPKQSNSKAKRVDVPCSMTRKDTIEIIQPVKKYAEGVTPGILDQQYWESWGLRLRLAWSKERTAKRSGSQVEYLEKLAGDLTNFLNAVLSYRATEDPERMQDIYVTGVAMNRGKVTEASNLERWAERKEISVPQLAQRVGEAEAIHASLQEVVARAQNFRAGQSEKLNGLIQDLANKKLTYAERHRGELRYFSPAEPIAIVERPDGTTRPLLLSSMDHFNEQEHRGKMKRLLIRIARYEEKKISGGTLDVDTNYWNDTWGVNFQGARNRRLGHFVHLHPKLEALVRALESFLPNTPLTSENPLHAVYEACMMLSRHSLFVLAYERRMGIVGGHHQHNHLLQHHQHQSQQQQQQELSSMTAHLNDVIQGHHHPYNTYPQQPQYQQPLPYPPQQLQSYYHPHHQHHHMHNPYHHNPHMYQYQYPSASSSSIMHTHPSMFQQHAQEEAQKRYEDAAMQASAESKKRKHRDGLTLTQVTASHAPKRQATEDENGLQQAVPMQQQQEQQQHQPRDMDEEAVPQVQQHMDHNQQQYNQHQIHDHLQQQHVHRQQQHLHNPQPQHMHDHQQREQQQHQSEHMHGPQEDHMQQHQLLEQPRQSQLRDQHVIVSQQELHEEPQMHGPPQHLQQQQFQQHLEQQQMPVVGHNVHNDADEDKKHEQQPQQQPQQQQIPQHPQHMPTHVLPVNMRFVAPTSIHNDTECLGLIQHALQRISELREIMGFCHEIRSQVNTAIMS